jgi:poly(hydroxyalkanoate) depolymerase family esterase
MTSNFSAAMRKAVELTRARNVMEATRVIQRALTGHGAPPVEEPLEGARLSLPRTLLSDTELEQAPAEAPWVSRPAADAAAQERLAARPRRPLGEVLRFLRHADRSRFDAGGAPSPNLRKAPPVTVPPGAAYLSRTFAGEAGSRDYKLYVPSRAEGRTLPLIVMLHGCTQNPDDFAVGTGMNRLAEEHGFLVAYPRQPQSANPSACWNWFDLKDQMRDEGEPSIIAGITRAVMSEFAVDRARVYVAGLSAGGAMAAIMGALYPELFAAAGIHSGLPYGSASDLPSALAAMRGASGPVAPTPVRRKSRPRVAAGRVVVFHGAVDKTVNPSNAEAILADAQVDLPGPVRETRHDGVAGGRAFTRTVIADAQGVPHAEFWAVEGLGHAWSGGSPEGSFTDPHGPDASREMLRFFLETPSNPSMH